MQIEMTIKGLMVDPITNTPIVILRDKDGDRVLPIWVGIFEANAIALQIENVTTPRPMTHDLLRNVIQDLKASVDRIVVSDVQDNTYYAMVYLALNGETLAIDARPSDAIALALRTRSPIYVEERVVDHARTVRAGLTIVIDARIEARLDAWTGESRHAAVEHIELVDRETDAADQAKARSQMRRALAEKRDVAEVRAEVSRPGREGRRVC